MDAQFKQQLSEEVNPLWRFALTLCNVKADAEDLLQKTVLRALEKADQYQRGTKLRSWLFSIMHSLWLNEKRSFRVRASALSKALISAEDEPSSVVSGFWQSSLSAKDDAQEQHQLLAEVLQTVMSLPEAQRYVVILVCVEGFSYQEAADILEVKKGTIMSRLARARVLIGTHFLASQDESDTHTAERDIQAEPRHEVPTACPPGQQK